MVSRTERERNNRHRSAAQGVRRRRCAVADLHPEVLKMIEAGPQEIDAKDYRCCAETPEEFARRIAALAVEKEREECANECAAEFVGNDGETLGDEDEAYNQAIRDCISAIRRRGKP